MSKAIEVPSAETRRLIADAIAVAEPAEHQLEQFIAAAKTAVAAFDADVNPLGLGDMDYERAVTASKLRIVLGLGMRMEAKLGKLPQRAA